MDSPPLSAVLLIKICVYFNHLSSHADLNGNIVLPQKEANS